MSSSRSRPGGGSRRGAAQRGPTPRRAPQRPAARPASTGRRADLERHSSPALVFLSRQPKWLLPVLTVLLLVAGLLLPAPLGAVPIALVLLLVGWLSYLSWPVVPRGGRVVRVVTLALILVLMLSRLQR